MASSGEGYLRRVVYGGVTGVSCLVDARAFSAPVTGIGAGSVTAWYVIPGAAPVNVPVVALASVTAGHAAGGWIEIDAANMPGVYRFDCPDLMFARGTPWARLHLSDGSSGWSIVDFDFFDKWLPADLGQTRGAWNSLLEAIQGLRAYVFGTHRFTRETGIEEILMPDRATVLATRAAEPSGGPITRLVERGAQTVRLPMPIGVVADMPNPTVGHLVVAPSVEVVADVGTPTIPVQGPIVEGVVEVGTPTLPVQGPTVEVVADVGTPTTS